MQDPLPTGMNFLAPEDITYYQEMPKNFDHYILSWDTAIKVSEKSDYSVGTCWGCNNGKYYFITMIRKKMSYPDLKTAIERQIERYNPKYVLIEDKASGQSLIQDLLLAGHVNIKAIKPKLDKATRFASVVNIFQSGKVLLPIKLSINSSLIRELTTFPNSKNDDIVDSVSQFLNYTKELGKKPAMRVRLI
jgi:predicted phage terminase large subunit-like protein